jgi:hypothetical protein
MANIIRVTGPSGIGLLVGSVATPPGSGQNYQLDTTGSVYIDPRDLAGLLEAGFTISEFPKTARTIFGGSATAALLGAFFEEGNIYRNAGNPIAGNGADTTDDILGGVQVPASAFDVLGRAVNVLAQGVTGATTNNKRFKVFVNPTMSGQTVNADGSISGGTVTAGTPICDSGAWVNATTPNNAAGWQAGLTMMKYGAGGSNTQIAQGFAILGTLHGGIQASQAATLGENAPINIVVTGSSYTTGAAGDVKLQMLQIGASN